MKNFKRSLVQQGTSTLMVSLPAPWIKTNNLEKGSEVTINPLNNDLLVSAKTNNYKSETNVTISGTESSIRTIITNTYRVGFDRIHVTYSNKEDLQILEDVVKTKLIGFEVVSRGKNRCIVENITEPSDEKFSDILNKILFNINELFAITSLRLSGTEPDENFEEVEERIQKYDNFCKRVISKQKYNNDKSELLWTFLVLILHGQRELYHLNKYINKLPKGFKAERETRELLEKAKALFELIKKSYLEKKAEYLLEVHTMEKELIYNKGYALLQKNSKDAVLIYHIMFSTRAFYQVNSPLSGIIIQEN
jgi:phosphate uptake regulator